MSILVMPAKAGIHRAWVARKESEWAPAFAGATVIA
jgi:hypothetical protein